jgi:hypothetical protein
VKIGDNKSPPFFGTVFDKDGVPAFSNTYQELGDRGGKPKEKYPPPSRARRKLAEYLAHRVLSSVGITDAKIYAIADKQVQCSVRSCQHINSWESSHCEWCGVRLNPKANFHSAVWWAGDKLVVALRKNVTQGKKPHKWASSILTPYKFDESEEGQKIWATYTHCMVVLAPWVYAKVAGERLDMFADALFRLNEHKRHKKFAVQMIDKYMKLLEAVT